MRSVIGCPMVADRHIRPPNLKSLYRILTGLSHVYPLDDLNSTSLPQDCVLGAASGSCGVECNAHFWGNGWGVGPPIARVQLGWTDAPIIWITSPNNNSMLKEERKLKLYYILNEIHRKQKKEDNRKETNI